MAKERRQFASFYFSTLVTVGCNKANPEQPSSVALTLRAGLSCKPSGRITTLEGHSENYT